MVPSRQGASSAGCELLDLILLGMPPPPYGPLHLVVVLAYLGPFYSFPSTLESQGSSCPLPTFLARGLKVCATMPSFFIWVPGVEYRPSRVCRTH